MRTYAYALPLALSLLAPGCATPLCGDSSNCAATDTATTSDTTGSTTEDPTAATTGTASEPTSTASETDATASETDATASETSTETSTSDTSTTDATATTAETTDATAGETTDGETTGGPLMGEPGTHGEACAPDDGPAVELKIALAERACDADWPEDVPLFRIVLFKGVDELQVGEHPLFGGFGFAWYDDGDGTPESTDQGEVVITEVTADGVRGTYEVTLPDDTLLTGAFDSLYCPSDVLCG